MPELGDRLRGTEMEPPRSAGSIYYWVRCEAEISDDCLKDRWTVISRAFHGLGERATQFRMCRPCYTKQSRDKFKLGPKQTPARPM